MSYDAIPTTITNENRADVLVRGFAVLSTLLFSREITKNQLIGTNVEKELMSSMLDDLEQATNRRDLAELKEEYEKQTGLEEMKRIALNVETV